MKGHFNKILRNIAARHGKNEFEKRLIKATYGHDSKEPKEKHVQFLFTAMHGGCLEATPKHVISSLNNRAMDNLDNWAVNLKVLIIYHKLIQDKKLSIITLKEFQDSCIQFYSYEKESSLKQNERIIQMISKRYVEYLQALCGMIQNEKKFEFIPKEKEIYKPILKKMSDKSLLKFLKRLHGLVELITEQFESKEFCQKSRLHSSYIQSIFEDYNRIYSIFYYGIQILKSKFSSLSSKKKSDVLNCYELFCKFNSDFKATAKTLPLLFNFDYKMPETYDPQPETIKKMKKDSTNSNRSNSIVEPPTKAKKIQKENRDDEIDFDDYYDEPLPTRTQSVVYKTSAKPEPTKKSKIQVEEFNTNAIDNLLLIEPPKKRQTMNPKQATNEIFNWDECEEQKDEGDIFEKADDVDVEENPHDIDKLFFDPKISLDSTQPKTGHQSINSNIKSSEGRFSAISSGLNNPFLTNGNQGYGMQHGVNQYHNQSYGNYPAYNMNRFSAPNTYTFNY